LNGLVVLRSLFKLSISINHSQGKHLKIIFLFAIFLSFSARAFDTYKTTREIPEPLVFDLVRRINSQKGEMEVNSLFLQSGDSEVKNVYVAPEFEYAWADGKAVELEFPTEDGKVRTLKAAFQFQLPSWIGDLTGLQLIYEASTEKSIHEFSPLLIVAKRLSRKWSVLAMIGNRFEFGNDPSLKNRKFEELPLVNFNLFYDYAKLFDLGLEFNLRGAGASFEEVLIMPQIHALLARDFKLQAGFGMTYDGFRFAPVSAFRFIKEFNH
jgi:hypothetical protein